MSEIDQLVICSPYDEPGEYWKFDGRDYRRTSGRRPAGYVIATDASKTEDARGTFIDLPLANAIRGRVRDWRNQNYPNVTSVTRELLDHWNRRDREVRADPLFFCQREAMETLIWLAEAPDHDKAGIEMTDDGGAFARQCVKMATGTGKTVVMAMLIAWQVLNKAHRPSDPRFSKNFLIMAPGLTVKSRLGVLWPLGSDSYYRRYSLVPDGMYEDLKQANVDIHNWHTFFPALDEHSVVLTRRTREDPESLARRMLSHGRNNIIVINDEAHHAYRRPAGEDASGDQKRDATMANRWMEGLDMIHKARGIRACYDFSATPYIPTGKNATEDDMFGWIVSDFGLNDAIESGLVKTPRMPPGDSADTSRYYHLFDEKSVKSDLKSTAKEDDQLPDLVRQGYMLLAKDWENSRDKCRGVTDIPPVMITVCNVTRTAARIEKFFQDDPFDFGELRAPGSLVRIDTDVIRMERGQTAMDGRGSRIRDMVNTVGQRGRPGEQIKNIVAVQMLSEGWDAKNVTQIMGLRAFNSQLLCEQVIGRGLRRQSYETDPDTGLFREEFVNIIGVPFSFMPHQGGPPAPEKPRVEIRPDPQNAGHEITWPNVSRIETIVRSNLDIDWGRVKPLRVSGRSADMEISVYPVLDGTPLPGAAAAELDLYEAGGNLRMQTLVFHAVLRIYRGIESAWEGDRTYMFAQIAKITERFVDSGLIRVTDIPKDHEDLRRRLAIMFNMNAVVGHVRKYVDSHNAETKKLIFGPGDQSKSTIGVRPWFTTKGVLTNVKKSHISPTPYDSDWEKKASQELEKNPLVESWAKNDRLGFSIRYQYRGEARDYFPDFLVKVAGSGGKSTMLVLEIKGQENAQSAAKRDALDEWVEAVNADGRFGKWAHGTARDPAGVDVSKIVKDCSKL